MFSLVYRATYHYIIIPLTKYNLNELIETKSLPKIVEGSLKILVRSFARFYSRITGIEILKISSLCSLGLPILLSRSSSILNLQMLLLRVLYLSWS